MSRQALVLVDFSNIIYKAAHVHAVLSYEGTPTGCLYGFLTQVTNAVNELRSPCRIVVCNDHKPYIRSSQFPAYKSDRGSEGPDPALAARVLVGKKMVREMLDAVGIPFWSVEGFECDDLIGHAVTSLNAKYDQTVAMSGDSDLFQLFHHDTTFRLYRGGKKGFYDRNDFIDEWGRISQQQLVEVMALAGTHNAVPGVKGVGVTTARKLLCGDPVVRRNTLAKYGDIMRRNIPLIHLPHPHFPLDSNMPEGGKVSDRAVMRFCARYGVNVTGKMLEAIQSIV